MKDPTKCTCKACQIKIELAKAEDKNKTTDCNHCFCLPMGGCCECGRYQFMEFIR